MVSRSKRLLLVVVLIAVADAALLVSYMLATLGDGGSDEYLAAWADVARVMLSLALIGQLAVYGVIWRAAR